MNGFWGFLQGQDNSKNKRDYCSENVNVIRPKNFNEIQLLLDSLKRSEGFIVDFENITVELAQRMLDFLSGAIYALEGKIEQIKDKMYIILPRGLNIKTKLTKG